MTVKIETILQFEEVQGLLERVQGSGAVDTAELNAVVEALELDSVETDVLLYELEIGRASCRERVCSVV